MNIKQTKLWKLFASIKLAIWLLAIIALVSIIGTIIVQNKSSAEYIAKYGPTAYKIFLIMGITTLYSAWWFISLLALLSMNLVVCLINSFSLRVRSIGTLIAHASVLVIFVGALTGMFFGHKGYVNIYEGRSINSFESNGKKVDLGFDVKLDDFIYEEYLDNREKLTISSKDGKELVKISPAKKRKVIIPGTDYTIKILRYVPDFVIDMKTKKVSTRSGEPRNPAIQVKLKKGDDVKKFWVFAAYPDIHNKVGDELNMRYVWAPRRPKEFISHLVVLEDGKEILKKEIRVNTPLKYNGYAFFQSSYDRKHHIWTGLQVVKDPGVPIVYLGFIMLIIGLGIRFYINPLLKK